MIKSSSSSTILRKTYRILREAINLEQFFELLNQHVSWIFTIDQIINDFTVKPRYFLENRIVPCSGVVPLKYVSVVRSAS